ncbi:MAG TPA: hypothetical protein VG499_10255 [Actinomycetota bacterium]|nr:hypothetical protein [Actinomycetota bacterium]
MSRRRFLRAAGVGTAGAMVAAGAVVGQAGAEVTGAAVPGAAQNIPARRKVVRAGGQQAAGVAVLAVSGPLSFHTISPQRYLDTRFDGGGPFPPQGSIGEFFIFDFGDPDYFSGADNEVPPEARALACNLTVTSGTSGGNLRAFPGNSDVIPLVSNLNWTTGQTVANYAIVAAATPADGAFQASIGLHNASTRGSVHVIVDISGYFV